MRCPVAALMSEESSQAQALMAGDGAKGVTTTKDRPLQISLNASESSVSGLLKWKINREASLAGKKEKLKTQQLQVEKLKSNSDEVRAETETIKAERQDLERNVASAVETMTCVKQENEKAKFQLNQVHKMMTGILI